MFDLIVFILSMPGTKATNRMRIWRALKSNGAGILRDGVYILPQSEKHHSFFVGLADAVKEIGGSTYIIPWKDPQTLYVDDINALFDRSEHYRDWLEKAKLLESQIDILTQGEVRKGIDALSRSLEGIRVIDFYPGKPLAQANDELKQLGKIIDQKFSPGEPVAESREITLHNKDHYQDRLWTTRSDLWIDRVASAWLIRRFIDEQAKFQWFDRNESPDMNATGFDFNGAEFSHVGEMVTFEVLAHSFQLVGDSGLARLARLIHYLDVGGIPMDEAAGVLAVISGIKKQVNGDDAFVDAASLVFESLYQGFTQSPENT